MFPIAAIAFVIIFDLAKLTESINYICNHSESYFYTTPQTNCAMYYQCQNNQKIDYKCPHGTTFNFHMQECVRDSNICHESNTCHEKDGFYPDVTQSCRRFFRCFNGTIISYENCNDGFRFNGKECEHADKVKCNVPDLKLLNNFGNNNDGKSSMINKRSCSNSMGMDKCQYLADGHYPDENSKDCKSYIKCLNGKKSHLRCPSSSIFHPAESACVPDLIYECPKSSRLERLCKGKSDGGLHSDPRFGCGGYVKCLYGIPIQFDECPNGQIFDNFKKSCVYKSNSYCHHEARSNDCMHLEMGYYQDRSIDSSCRNFYFCYNGRKTSYSCPHNEIFNGESCVDDHLYMCPNLDEDSCDTKEDGYYKDNNLDCRSYFYCSSHRKYSFVCKDGQAFDGKTCVIKRHVELCQRNFGDCSGKPDGYYQDLKLRCMKYFYCKQGEKLQVLTCRNGRVFNGNSCVLSQTYFCPSVGHNLSLKLNCITRKCQTCLHDGFYADYDSRCKNYYFCVNGIQTKLSCLKNFVFNEDENVCVPATKYQCPVYCSNECS